MLSVIIVFCIVVIVVGIVLVRGSGKRSVFKTHGVELDAPAGSGLIAVALFVIAYSYSMTTRLSAEKKGIEDNLAKTQTDLASTKNDLKLIEESLEQQKAETKHLESKNAELEKKLANEQTERRDAEKQMMAAWKTVDQVQLTHTQKEEFDRLKDGVLKLNEKLTMLRISVAHFPRIENRKAVATFEIYRKAFEPDQNRPRGAGLFNFNSREYEIRMISGNQEGIPDKLKSEFIDVICEAARRAAINQISLSGAIDSIAPLKGYDINRPVVAQLTEFTYIQMRLRMMAAEVLVLVRGYADGELSPWQEPLKKPFSNILVHENIDPNSPGAKMDLFSGSNRRRSPSVRWRKTARRRATTRTCLISEQQRLPRSSKLLSIAPDRRPILMSVVSRSRFSKAGSIQNTTRWIGRPACICWYL
jgi:hypothetical protein